jgi:hypothetical protein
MGRFIAAVRLNILAPAAKRAGRRTKCFEHFKY